MCLAGYFSCVLKVFTLLFHVEILCFHNCYLPSKSLLLLLPRCVWPALADHGYLSTQRGSWIEPQSQHCAGYNKNKFTLVFLSLSPRWRFILLWRMRNPALQSDAHLSTLLNFGSCSSAEEKAGSTFQGKNWPLGPSSPC